MHTESKTSNWKLLHYSEANLAHIIILLIPVWNSCRLLPIISGTCPAAFHELLASSIFFEVFSVSAMKNVTLDMRSLADRGESKSIPVTMWEFCLFIIHSLDKKAGDGRLASDIKLQNKSKKLKFGKLRTRRKGLFFPLYIICGTVRAAEFRFQCYSWNLKVMMTPDAGKALI